MITRLTQSLIRPGGMIQRRNLTNNTAIDKQITRLKNSNNTDPERLKHAKECLKIGAKTTKCEKIMNYIAEFGYHKPHQKPDVVVTKATTLANDLLKNR